MAAGTAPEPGTVSPPKIREITGWLMRYPDALDTHDQQRLACLRTQCPRLNHLADHVTSFAKMITERTRSPGTGGLANTGGSRRPAGTALLCRRDPPRPRYRHRRAHPPLQQQVTQGLSVVKIGILLAPWHRRPGPGRGARALGFLPAVTVMTTPSRATAP